MAGHEDQRGPFAAAVGAARSSIARRRPEELAERIGGTRVSGGIGLAYFGRDYTISLPSLDCSPALPDMERALLLRYLASEGEVPASREWVSFHHLPGGSFYEQPYRRRGVARILAAFAGEPGRLVAAGAGLGGFPAGLGDASVSLRVLPRIEVVVVLNLGDEELPAEADLLFGRDIVAYFSLEDVAVLAGVVASRLTLADRHRD